MGVTVCVLARTRVHGTIGAQRVHAGTVAVRERRDLDQTAIASGVARRAIAKVANSALAADAARQARIRIHTLAQVHGERQTHDEALRRLGGIATRADDERAVL